MLYLAVSHSILWYYRLSATGVFLNGGGRMECLSVLLSLIYTVQDVTVIQVNNSWVPRTNMVLTDRHIGPDYYGGRTATDGSSVAVRPPSAAAI